MSAIRWLLRLIAAVFHGVLALFVLGVGLVGLFSRKEVRFPLIPGLEGEPLIQTMAASGAAGLLILLWALRGGRFGRFLFVLWNLLVVSLLLCAAFRPSYRFEGPEELQQGAILFGISLLALWGSWLQFRARRRKA